jgi:PAS domain S-box-containing protein
VIGASLIDYLHPDDRELAQDTVARAFETGTSQCAELRVRDPAGRRWRYFDGAGTPLRDGNEIVGLVVNARDVTERREAEDAVRAERAFRQAIENSLLAGVRVVDLEGRLIYVNPAFCQMLGWEAHELIGATPPYPYWPADEQARLKALLDETLGGHTTNASMELTYRRQDGERIDVLVMPSALRDGSGAVRGWLDAVYDVTERKRLEEQLRQAQKMEAVGRLAGGIAHDFNNLLTAILGYAELGADALGPEHPVAADLAEVRKAGESATRLVGQLLSFSRRQVVEPQTLDLNVVAQNLEGMLSRVIGEDVTLIVDPGRHVPPVEADQGQIEQVIMNLAVNARDAMPEGGRLSIRTAALDVDESLAQRVLGLQPGAHARLTVQDSGTGMDASVLAHLFEPFFTTKAKGKGTGLGLATVYGIVSQAGGQIDVQSAPGQGTTFEIYLPAAVATAGAAVHGLGGGAARTGHVLLVEDEEAVRGLARRILVDAGFSVSDGTAEEALALARQPGARFDLLLTDVVMPDMSGGELAAQFTGLHAATPVMFMSGYTDDQIVRAGVEAGTAALVRKPFTASSLLAKVREVLAAAECVRTQPPRTGR